MSERGNWIRTPKFWGKLKPRLREFRQESTPAEAMLWEQLRDRKLLGLKFRRQHPIDQYAADFCCPIRKLIVELDGGVHVRQAEQDRIRQAHLEAKGYRVLRFRNDEVLETLASVVARIEEAVTKFEAHG